MPRSHTKGSGTSGTSGAEQPKDTSRLADSLRNHVGISHPSQQLVDWLWRQGFTGIATSAAELSRWTPAARKTKCERLLEDLDAFRDSDGQRIISFDDLGKLRKYLENCGCGGLLGWFRDNATRPMGALRQDALGKGSKVNARLGL